jgi:hypothetical protein
MPKPNAAVLISKAVHWDGSAGNEPVIVQIIGEGPARSIQVDSKEPMCRVVSHEKGI